MSPSPSLLLSPSPFVALALPQGESITSTYPFNKYAVLSGTSMATAHTTGAAALWAAFHPTSTAADIKAAILSKARYSPYVDGKVATNGILDVSTF